MPFLHNATQPTAAPTPPVAPTVPPGAKGFPVSSADLQARPITQADVDALKAKRSELMGQLSAAEDRTTRRA